ncbi:MAG: hypothetical protein JNK85_22160 [Verrucomicrobiales bacterium]|nr:hypothetical protein [Verrucomicrobiales bacterium]
MNSTETKTPASAPDPLSAAEAHLGRALALLHRVIPRLDDPNRAEAVQSTLDHALQEITAARAAHDRTVMSLRPAPVEGEVLALIAAAVAVVLGRPHRLLDVQKAAPAVTWVNAWAIEGRFQHYSSHKVR